MIASRIPLRLALLLTLTPILMSACGSRSSTSSIHHWDFRKDFSITNIPWPATNTTDTLWLNGNLEMTILFPGNREFRDHCQSVIVTRRNSEVHNIALHFGYGSSLSTIKSRADQLFDDWKFPASSKTQLNEWYDKVATGTDNGVQVEFNWAGASLRISPSGERANGHTRLGILTLVISR